MVELTNWSGGHGEIMCRDQEYSYDIIGSRCLMSCHPETETAHRSVLPANRNGLVTTSTGRRLRRIIIAHIFIILLVSSRSYA